MGDDKDKKEPEPKPERVEKSEKEWFFSDEVPCSRHPTTPPPKPNPKPETQKPKSTNIPNPMLKETHKKDDE